MKSGQRPAKKAGRAYGVNAGLAVAGRNRNRVKNRQSGRKLFFGLIYSHDVYFLMALMSSLRSVFLVLFCIKTKKD